MLFLLFWCIIFFAAQVVFRVVEKLRDDRLSTDESLLIALATAPIFTAYGLYYLLVFFPWQTDFFYCAAVCGTILLVNLLMVNQVTIFGAALAGSFGRLVRLARQRPLMAAVAVVLVVLIGLKTVAYPYISDDATCYALLGRYFYHAKSLFNYPMRFAAENGMLIAQKHPLGQILLYTLSYLINGSAANDLVSRSISFYYFVILIASLGVIVRRLAQNRNSALAAVLVLAATPLAVEMTIFNTLDPARMVGFLLSTYACYLALTTRSWRYGALFVLVFSAALFIHLSVIILVPVLAALVIGHNLIIKIPLAWLRNKLPLTSLPALMILACLMLALVLPGRYFYRLVVPPSAPCASAPAGGAFAGESEHATPYGAVDAASVGPGLAALQAHFFGNINTRHLAAWMGANAILKRLSPFTRILYYSFTFWLWVIAVALLLARRTRLSLAEYFFLGVTVLGFAGITACQYANPRYMLTILPAVCVVIAFGYDQQVSAGALKTWTARILLALFIMFLLSTALAVGILRKGSLRHLFLGQSEKLLCSTRDFEGARDYFKALDYINRNLDSPAKILVFRHAVFFYYTHANGIVFRYSRNLKPFRREYYAASRDPAQAAAALKDIGCDYILTDPAFSRYNSYRNSVMPLLYRSEHVRLVYQSGAVCLYKLN